MRCFSAPAPIPAAALTFKFGVLSFELLLITAALISGLISLAIGALCVRYTRIFFGC
jgi:branched-chain amino acid transport system permease protein